MPETLTELVARISTDATELKQGLAEGEKATEASSKRMAESLKKVGVAMAASGAAITAALGLMGKAAIDEEINIKRLATTINNSGTAYDKVKDSLEAVIAATQRKTGIADDEQRDILTRLILVTNDYGKAMELLPTVLDLAAAGEMEATTAATYLGKAYLELEEGAEEVTVRFGQASLQFENMEDIQNRVAGAAENLANPLSVLKASIGDVAEEIGMTLIPLIKDATSKIIDIAIKVQEWVKEHPALAKTLTLVSLALGAVLTVVGGLILIMPALISGVTAFGVVFHVALGPIGLISLAIAGLITAGILLWKNWDKVVMFFKEAWINLKLFFLEGVQSILDSLSNFTRFIPGLNSLVDSARNKIANMIEATKLEEDALRAEKALRDVSEALEETTEIVELNTDATKEQTKAAKENIKALKEQQEELLELTAKLKNMRREYEYARSDAGRLRISLQDVTFALFDMGKTTDELTEVFSKLGDDANDVNKVMEAFGLTAQQIKDILDAQKESVDAQRESVIALGEAYIKTNEKASITPKTGRISGGGIVRPTYSSAAERLSEEHGMSLNAAQETIERYSANPKSEEFAPVKGIMESIVGYQRGGLVKDTGLAYLHEGETIIPANRPAGIVVNFTQPVFFDREDTMNKFVDMIRKGIQRQDRLRYGGAYSG